MIADIIHEVARMSREDDEQEYRPRPSLAGRERCVRQLYYMAVGAEREKTGPRMYVVFDDSSWAEELTLDWLRKSAYQVHSQQMAVDCEPPMGKGRIDGIITDPTGVDRLLEHKAINHFTFERYAKAESIHDLPWDYITQTCIYLHGLQKVNPEMNEALLLIKNKNTGAYLEFLLSYKWDHVMVHSRVSSAGDSFSFGIEREGIYQNALDRFAQIKTAAETGAPPPRQYDSEHWRCDYCPYKTGCRADYAETVGRDGAHALTADEAAAVTQYIELNARANEIAKVRDVAKQGVRDLMAQHNAASAAGAGVTVELVSQTRPVLKPTDEKQTISILKCRKAKEK